MVMAIYMKCFLFFCVDSNTHPPCSSLQEVLHAYPQIIVDPLDSGVVRVRLSGDAYNRKTLNRVKKSLPKPQVGGRGGGFGV